MCPFIFHKLPVRFDLLTCTQIYRVFRCFKMCILAFLLLLFFVLKTRLYMYLFWVLIRRQRAHEDLCFIVCIYQAVKMQLSVPKIRCLWMKDRNKDWWCICPAPFHRHQWKENFRMTRQSFMTLIIQQQQLVLCIIHNYTSSTSLHILRTFQFLFSFRSSFYMSYPMDQKRLKPPLTT